MTIDLDHVAIAVQDVGPVLRTLVGELGAEVLYGGTSSGFRALQVDCGDLPIELIEPYNVDENDFLARFLARSGEGPHHLTFKTDDIRRELDRLTAAGYHPVGVNLGNPLWMEAFLHPKQAGSVVVQVAQSGFESASSPGEVSSYVSQWWPDPPERSPSRSVLKRVVVTTDEFGRALDLYRDLLGGEVCDHDEGWTELGWPGGGRIRLEVAAGRRIGIERLEWLATAGSLTDRTVAGTRFCFYSN